MKERPILFSGPMVRAILEGRKTQTRRVVKRVRMHEDHGPPLWDRAWLDGPADSRYLKVQYGTEDSHPAGGTVQRHFCPYGGPGDVLLVKESWSVARRYDHLPPSKLPAAAWRGLHWAADGPKPRGHGRVRPGRFLPNRRVRTRLNVERVLVERLQAISEVDAIAEGFTVKASQEVFAARAGTLTPVEAFYVTFDREDQGEDLCYKCAVRIAGEKGELNAGLTPESDGPAYCGQCTVPLQMSLSQYGIERELFMENADDEREHWPAGRLDAAIAAQFTDGIGDLREKHHGRVAQIAFATLWEAINGKAHPWASNPWVWVVEFGVVKGGG